MLNAIPFFITRLEGSPFKNTFGSFLTTAFTIANFVFLAHGTATVKKVRIRRTKLLCLVADCMQASHERRGFISIVSLAVLVALLTLSTYLHVSSGLFFTFVLLNGVAQAAAGSYLQTSIVAVASLFGPIAMQSVMSGQAAVAVAISIVQLVSTYISVHASKSSSADRVTLTSEPEEQSAFMFFSISTLFLILSAAAQAWLFRLPAYKSIVSEFNHITHIAHEDSDNNLETSNLVSSSPTLSSDSKDGFAQVVRVAKTNSIFNIAVAYVFVITLVRINFVEGIRIFNLTNAVIGCLPFHHALYPIYQSLDPSTHIQCNSLLGDEYRRLDRSLHVLYSTAHDLVW